MKTKHHRLTFASLPFDYAALCGLFLPRPIHDDTGYYEDALELIEAMAGWGGLYSGPG